MTLLQVQQDFSTGNPVLQVFAVMYTPGVPGEVREGGLTPLSLLYSIN